MEKILLPIDLSHRDKTTAIFEEAKKFQAERDVKITVLHVVSAIPESLTLDIPKNVIEDTRNEARATLETMVRDHGLSPLTKIEVRSGVPHDEIVSLAEEEATDLIIIASHKPTVADYLLGSVAAAVVRHAPCSVLVKR